MKVSEVELTMLIIAIIFNFMIIVDANFLSCIHNIFLNTFVKRSDAVTDSDCILDQ